MAGSGGAAPDGTVSLRVFEGYVESAVYQGADVPEAVRSYVQKIIGARPLTAAVLERYLLLINDIPGVTAHAALAQSAATTGAAELTLVAAVQKVAGDAAIDNRLTRSLGPARVSASGELVTLDEQDRGAWDAALIAEGHALVRERIAAVSAGQGHAGR